MIKYDTILSTYLGVIKQERAGQLLTFTRESSGKKIEFQGNKMTAEGYDDLSELLDDIGWINQIDHEELDLS
jgi:hypothetical protein